jgi:two-component system chemotaxis sensor kinase CheA
MDINKFKDIFISEVEDNLQKINENLLLGEKLLKQKQAGDQVDEKKYREVFDSLMRSAHTLKSSSATMGYTKMAFLTHVLEDVFDNVRNGISKISVDTFEVIFESVDMLSESLRNIKDNNIESDLESYSLRIKELFGTKTDEMVKVKKVQDIKKDESIKKETDIPVYKIKSNETENISHVKVPIKRLDSLMDLSEELLAEKMRLNSILDSKIENSSFLNKEDILSSLKPAVEHLNLLISNLQYSVMQSRLVPAGQIFARFPRMIRDLANKSNKEIDLIITGEDIEMDRSIIDKLAEPLGHLLRNAVDHGIQEKGIIRLEAKHSKDHASIIIEDNGFGIRWKELVNAALKREIINAEKSNEYLSSIEMNPQSIWQPILEKDLLYNPRLSTNDSVTETSGRGVGTSVIKEFVDQIGGDIEVVSPVNNNGGTRFTLNLPLTLAIIKVLLVKINNSTFAIPFSSIIRSVYIDNSDIKSVAEPAVVVQAKER